MVYTRWGIKKELEFPNLVLEFHSSRGARTGRQISRDFSFSSWLYTNRFSCFDMFVHYFMNYFVRLRTNHYTLLTILPILFIFDSARNLTRNFPYLLFDVSWKYRLSGETGKTRDEKNDWQDGLRNARMAKREIRKMIGKMVYEMLSIHLSVLSFRQQFFAFLSIWR